MPLTSLPKLAWLLCVVAMLLRVAPSRARAADPTAKAEQDLKKAQEEIEAKLRDTQQKRREHAAEMGGSDGDDVCIKCDQPVTGRQHGCSIPDGLTDSTSNRGREEFKPFCNRHDRCYSTPGHTQLACDLRLRHDMLGRCRELKNTDPFKLLCAATADTWFGFVRGFGSGKLVGGGYKVDQEWAKKAHCEAKKTAKCGAGWIDLDSGK
jgi:hypothetical protein